MLANFIQKKQLPAFILRSWVGNFFTYWLPLLPPSTCCTSFPPVKTQISIQMQIFIKLVTDQHKSWHNNTAPISFNSLESNFTCAYIILFSFLWNSRIWLYENWIQYIGKFYQCFHACPVCVCVLVCVHTLCQCCPGLFCVIKCIICLRTNYLRHNISVLVWQFGFTRQE